MRSLAIVLLLGLAVGLAMVGFMGLPWLVLLPGLLIGAVFHWIIWAEDIGSEVRAGHFSRALLPLGRDLAGLAAAFAAGLLLNALFLGTI